ncbi:MAG: hypothetical protein HRT57_04240 [Crocinitomicaceae bacterium]|nr:hypothetical protein [Crocinitomicaceae bacterium]
MKLILTTLTIAITFISTSQSEVMNWDQRFEKAKFEAREGATETYTTHVLKVNENFTKDEFYDVQSFLEEDQNIFKMELDEATGALVFYHKPKADGYYLMTVTKKALGEVRVELGPMAPYKFE